MFRTTLAALTITALLLCPLRCAAMPAAGSAEAAVGSATAAQVVSGCSCCQPSGENQPVRPTDQPSDDDCECANCLCHGAVLESDTKFASVAALPFSIDRPLIEFALATPAAETMNRNERTRYRFCLSGRATCVLQQSLQI